MNYRLKLGALLLIFISFIIFVSKLDLAVFSGKGTIALAERNLIFTTFALMLIVVIPVYVMIFWFSRKYRADNPSHHRYSPNWAKNSALEFTWWAIPIAIVATLAVITWNSTHALDPYLPLESAAAPITVQVVALDWKWLFIYPKEGIASVNVLEFPVDTPVNFIITADAPMNSFWIPELGGQVYAMSGMVTQLSLMANQQGEFKGLSSNFSGEGFAEMKFIAKAVSEEEYQAWKRIAASSSQSLSREGYDKLRMPSKKVAPAIFSLSDKDLFNAIVMKYMAPMKGEADKKESMLMPTDQSATSNSDMTNMDEMTSTGNKGTPL